MTEAQLMAGLIQAARTLGYLCLHVTEARRSEPGFPDVLCVHPSGAIVVFECKTQGGRLRPASVTKRGRWLPGQADWLAAFNAAGVPAYVVRPVATSDSISYDQALQALRDGLKEAEAA